MISLVNWLSVALLGVSTAYQLQDMPAHPLLLKRWVCLLLLIELEDFLRYFLDILPFSGFCYGLAKFVLIHPDNRILVESLFFLVKFLDLKLLASVARKVGRLFLVKFACFLIGLASKCAALSGHDDQT
jgi:hypothetical protein